MPIRRSNKKKSSVYLATSSDGNVLYDPANDRFLVLNSMSVHLWRLLCASKSESDVAEIISHEYDVAPERVAADVKSIVHRAAQMGWAPDQIVLTEPESLGEQPRAGVSFPWYGQDANARRPEPKLPMIIAAWVGLAFFDLILASCSFDALTSWIKRIGLALCPGGDRCMLPGQICSAVEKACVMYPRKAVCLQRSAVTVWLLRRHGFAARMILGVRPMPFQAHAWVDVEGVVVNDFSRVTKLYLPLAAY